MQKKRILRLCCAVLMVSLSACEYEDDFPAGVGEGNIEAIVLNEGRIGTNMGAISVLYRNGMVSPDVFRVVNNRPLGDVAQSITMINGKYFIALNNSKKIEIVNSKTFESEGTILYTQAGLPRQIVAISDTTAIVSDLLSNNVSGVDFAQPAGTYPYRTSLWYSLGIYCSSENGWNIWKWLIINYLVLQQKGFMCSTWTILLLL